MKIEGKVLSVSVDRGGIKIGDVWYNAIGEALAKITKKVYMKNVSIDVLDETRKTFEHIEIKDTPVLNLTKDGFWERKEQRDLINDNAKARGASINTALEILKIAGKVGTPQEILQDAQVLSKKIREYVEEKEE